jgi:hypothetical protein
MTERQDNEIELPAGEHYECLSPEVGEAIYAYLIGELEGSEARCFEDHLFLCFHCQEAYRFFLDTFARMRKAPDKYFLRASADKADTIRVEGVMEASGGGTET